MKHFLIYLFIFLLKLIFLQPVVAQVAPAPPAKELNPIIKLNKRVPNPSPIPDSISIQVMMFFQNLIKGGESVRKAYEQLLEGSRLTERKENLELFQQKTEDVIKMFGKIVDWEHYDTQKIGKRMLVIHYLTWHELYPVQWRLIYYQPADKWILIDLTFSTSVEDLIE